MARAAALLRPVSLSGDDWRWRLPSGGEPGAIGAGTLAGAAEALVGQRVMLLMPGAEVLTTQVQVPARSRAKAAAAIPWAMEDRLVTEVDDLHFALGPVDTAGNWPVAVIARSVLDAYLTALRGAGLEPHSIVAEPLALPAPSEQAWTVLEEPDRVTVRSGTYSGFAAEPDLVAGIATALSTPAHIDRLLAPRAQAILWPEALQRTIDAAGEPRKLDDALHAFDPDQAAIDLRQGPYSRAERIGRVARQWRAPAALAGALVLLAITGMALDYARLGDRQRQLRERMEQVFRETFPEVQRVVNPRAQMRTRLRSLREGGDPSGFLDLLARAGEPLTSADGITLQGLKWRQARLRLELQATDLQLLDNLRGRLSEAGLKAELERAERQGDQVAGRIVVTEAEE